ncbi:MAG TPA: nucleotidyltransferase domain-containing protein [Candidatus Ratteibacteria bacterium]|nr:nucleotidyltransferase domain-containing protein [bacterium]HRS05414.1 nucleotidyltransferase domain-containing protein [Candidatus Ratteibacteria bacterium]HRV04294.1 nucleotidyltransferase domain-containing protein [Candidatus Ratteibacteria bacterium]
MKEEDLKIARALKERLSKVIKIVDLRVFGSRAKGQADEYSDMDVFIEIETMDKETEDLINNIVWEVGIENSIYISPLIFTRYEIEESPLKESPIVKNIEEEGIRI